MVTSAITARRRQAGVGWQDVLLSAHDHCRVSSLVPEAVRTLVSPDWVLARGGRITQLRTPQALRPGPARCMASILTAAGPDVVHRGVAGGTVPDGRAVLRQTGQIKRGNLSRALSSPTLSCALLWGCDFAITAYTRHRCRARERQTVKRGCGEPSSLSPVIARILSAAA